MRPIPPSYKEHIMIKKTFLGAGILAAVSTVIAVIVARVRSEA